MSTHKKWFLGGVALSFAACIFVAATSSGSKAGNISDDIQKMGIVNFNYCLDKSKLGKREKNSFEELKKQIESSMQAKEKELNDLAPKLNEEYIDTLTPEAEAELKNKFRALSQECSQIEQQSYQLLQQSYSQVMQKLQKAIAKASQKVSQERNLSCTLNEDACFFYNKDLDISEFVVSELDAMYDKEEFPLQPTR